jgi:hypothetical protein
VVGTGLLGWRYVRQRRHWTTARLGMTHDLVERLAGHRTRLAHEAPAHWHDGEDAALDPTTLQQALRCVLERVPTLVVIAHP